MTNFRRGVFAALALVVSGLPGAAFADFKPSAQLRSACMSDAMRLCSSSLTSMSSLLACMQAKKSQASAGCQAAFDAEAKTVAHK
jgi:hypothetical protein